MSPFERLSVVYFAALALAALAMHRRCPRAWLAFGSAAGLVAAIVVASRTAAPVRAWMGHAYLVAGYWIPGLLVAAGEVSRFERWLVEADRAWRPYASAIPRWLAHVCEVAYLLCYPLVPAAFAVVWSRGGDTDISRFWVAVLAAGFACYGPLPWLVSRPPRSLPDARRPVSWIGRVNTVVLDRVSHRLNTFPSGHVAVSLAAALSVWPVSPVAAILFAAIAVGVAIGAVTGRYHYVPDVLAGDYCRRRQLATGIAGRLKPAPTFGVGN